MFTITHSYNLKKLYIYLPKKYGKILLENFDYQTDHTIQIYYCQMTCNILTKREVIRSNFIKQPSIDNFQDVINNQPQPIISSN